MRRNPVAAVLFLLVLLVGGFVWLGYRTINRSLVPDGASEDEVPGLGADAAIARDPNGIVYITATSDNDAWASLGYAHAQDRLWQMDLMRRAGAGRLSEIFGGKTIEADRFLRTIGIARTAQDILEAMPARTRSALEAYARGVNAYIATHRTRLPFEFDALNYEPEEWKPLHTVIITRMLAWELNGSFWTDIVLGEARNRLDSARFHALLPHYPSDAPTVVPGTGNVQPQRRDTAAPPPPQQPRDTAARAATRAQQPAAGTPVQPNRATTPARTQRTAPATAQPNRSTSPPRTPPANAAQPRTRQPQGTTAPAQRPANRPASRPPAGRAPNQQTGALPPRVDLPEMAGVMEVDHAVRQRLGIAGSHIGSNAWAVAGSRTESGRPMLANDPHLGHSAPSKWYQASITVRGRHRAGVTIPGVPFIVIGRNDSIAWGATSLMTDETDFFVLRLDTTRRDAAIYDERPDKLTVLYDTIRVKDSASVPIRVRISRHGPVISDCDPYTTKSNATRDSLPRTPSRRDTLALAMRWRGNDVSQELSAWQEMNDADTWREFSQATRRGGVPGLSFIYADAHGTIGYVASARVPIRDGSIDGSLPRPGWDSRYAWKGTMPMESLPIATSPRDGMIISANNPPTSNWSAMGEGWEDPSRAIRIHQLLDSAIGLNPTDMIQMQSDVVSPQMRMMVDTLLHAFPDSARQSGVLRAAIGLLARWDGAMSENSSTAAIAAMWYQTLVEMTFRDELGPLLYRRYVMTALSPIRALRNLVQSDSPWFDDVATRDVREHRDDILRTALGRAIESLHRRFGTWDMSQWRYGALHTLTMRHPFDVNASFAELVNIGPIELSGSNTTLNNGEWDFNEPFAVRVGPSMRMVVDFSDTTAFLRSVITTGASGQPLSSAYKNQATLWLVSGLLSIGRELPPADMQETTTLHPKK